MTKPIDHRKHYILVIDIETANDIENAIAYDLGFVVADRKGNIYETHSLMISEIFINHAGLLKSAYYAEKIPSYWKDYAKGERKMVSIVTAKRMIYDIVKEYRIKDIFAYNASFDMNGLNRTLRYLTKSKYRWFFPYGTKINCIWHMACQTILQQKAFFDFAIKNGLVKNGKVSTTAETAYRYICKDNTFAESHTGLEDVMIETQILAKCYAQHKPMDTTIRYFCSNLPQRKFKEFQKKT